MVLRYCSETPVFGVSDHCTTNFHWCTTFCGATNTVSDSETFSDIPMALEATYNGKNSSPAFAMKHLLVNRKKISAFVSLAIFFIAAALSLLFQDAAVDSRIREPEVLVSRVVDGDTIELSSGEKVRYIGINAPESVDPRRGVQCFGKEASAKNKELVEGKMVRLERDISETDKYGRLLRYVFIGGIFVNEYLVREGFARASSYPPDVHYQDLFQDAEREAIREKHGLWSSETCGK